MGPHVQLYSYRHSTPSMPIINKAKANEKNDKEELLKKNQLLNCRVCFSMDGVNVVKAKMIETSKYQKSWDWQGSYPSLKVNMRGLRVSSSRTTE